MFNKFENDDRIDEKKPRLTSKQREANAVKSEVMKELTSDDSPIKSQLDKLFKYIEKEVKKRAKQQGVSLRNINLDKITLRRPD